MDCFKFHGEAALWMEDGKRHTACRRVGYMVGAAAAAWGLPSISCTCEAGMYQWFCVLEPVQLEQLLAVTGSCSECQCQSQ